MHSLLRRQLKRLRLNGAQLPSPFDLLVQMVDDAYGGFDADRSMLERSLELSSTELLQKNSEMRAVLDAFPDVFIWLDRDGTILRAQHGRAGIPCLPAGPLKGEQLQAILPDEAGVKLQQALQRVRQHRELSSFEYSMNSPDGPGWYEARLLSLLDEHVLVVVRDITEEKRQQSDRLRSSKLDSVSLLAGGIAHDFNNILAAILANVSVAQLDVDKDGELHELLSEVGDAARRAQALTHQLLTFSKGNAPIKEAASVRELIEESARFCLRGSKVGCEFDLSPDLMAAEIDHGQISQVLNNLIINANQAMPDGGTLVIEAHNSAVAPRPGDGSTPRSSITIRITDHGVGIPAENLERIFDPYFTTKERGSGLGLATSYAIVSNHGGLLEVESVVGVGTTFSITLPAADAAAHRKPTLSAIPLGSAAGRVLVMDDDDDIRRTVRRMLARLGYGVVLAADGVEAVALYERALAQRRPFDVIIMDLTIPGGMGGIEAMRALRAVHPRVCAVVSSGYSNDFDLPSYRSEGFAGVLPKPFDIRELNKVLRNVLASAGELA